MATSKYIASLAPAELVAHFSFLDEVRSSRRCPVYSSAKLLSREKCLRLVDANDVFRAWVTTYSKGRAVVERAARAQGLIKSRPRDLKGIRTKVNFNGVGS